MFRRTWIFRNEIVTVPFRSQSHDVFWFVPLPPKLHTIRCASMGGTEPLALHDNAKLRGRAPPAGTKSSGGASKKKKKKTLATQVIGHPLALHKTAANKRHTLVLDIDETLLQRQSVSWHPVGGLETAHVALRPHVGQFLREMHELFEIVLWTAAPTYHGGAMAGLLERTAGLPPSTYYDAEVQWKCLASKEYVSAEKQKTMKFAPVLGEDHVNWYLLTQSFTVDSYDDGFDNMKYLPLLGRDLDSVIIIDDKTRSFPLTPRAGIKIEPFTVDKQNDTELLKLLPMLRSVAAADSAIGELDHWRPDDYVECDTLCGHYPIGRVLPERRSNPIPPQQTDEQSARVHEAATTACRKWVLSWCERDQQKRQVEAASFLRQQQKQSHVKNKKK